MKIVIALILFALNSNGAGHQNKNEEPKLRYKVGQTYGADWTALHVAVYNGLDGVVKELIEANVNLEAKLQNDQMHGCTALHLAVFRDQPKIAKMLIDANADVNAKDFKGRTPLHVWKRWSQEDRKNQLEIVQMLIDAKADVNANDYKGRTPLHSAASCNRENQLEVVQRLIDGKADVNAKDPKGRTALHLAVNCNVWKYGSPKARENRLKIVQILIDAEADVTAKDSEGRTALFIASTKSFKDLNDFKKFEELFNKGAANEPAVNQSEA